jgi:23S rRNA G2069 N7-methylase RlmK/C1962 C5-methylase RlmI
MEENEVEKAFYNNIRSSNMEKRIRGIKGDSFSVLNEMMKKREMYDLIVVDGCDTELGIISDLLLSWQIVNKGGVLVISRNEKAVHEFIHKVKNECVIKIREPMVIIKKI